MIQLRHFLQFEEMRSVLNCGGVAALQRRFGISIAQYCAILDQKLQGHHTSAQEEVRQLYKNREYLRLLVIHGLTKAQARKYLEVS